MYLTEPKILTLWPFTGEVSDSRHGEMMIRMKSDFSLEIIETKTQWYNILLKGKQKMNPEFYTQQKYPSKIEAE